MLLPFRFAYPFTLIAWSFCLHVSAQAPQANKPVPGDGLAPLTTLLPEALPATYPTASKQSYVRTREATIPLKEMTLFDAAVRGEVLQSTGYFDGLGRPLQTVVRDAAVDIVSPVIYDHRGREASRYLPFTKTGIGDFDADPFHAQKNFYKSAYLDADGMPVHGDEAFFYGRTEYEPSPLNRPVKTLAPGDGWVGSGRAKAVTYGSVTASEKIPVWLVGNDPGPEAGEGIVNMPVTYSFHADGALLVTTMTDEDLGQVIEYRDHHDLVLVRKVREDKDGPGWLTTYYVYDDMSRLRFVVPPKAVEQLQVSGLISPETARELCFAYAYDGRGRMTHKKIPGAGWQRMIYDRADRLVFKQTASQEERQEWLTICYDVFGREVLTGLLKSSLSRSALQEHVESRTASYSSVSTDAPAYAVRAWMNPCPAGTTLTALTITHYDDYTWTDKRFTDAYNNRLPAGTSLSAEDMPGNAIQQSIGTKGLPTGTIVRVLDNDPGSNRWLMSVNYYDNKGRVIQQQADNYFGGQDITTTRYDFAGHVLAEYQFQRNPEVAESETRLLTSMEYDLSGRLVQTFQTVNDLQETRRLVSRLKYDILGKLSAKELGFTKAGHPLERQQFSYNLQGWLTGINGRKLGSGDAIPASSAPWFSMALRYDRGIELARYGGSISAMQWRSRGDGVARAYGFSYDGSSRLLGADYSEASPGSQQYSESKTLNLDVAMGDGATAVSAYDAGGNIQRMRQWGYKQGQSRLIDELAYRYVPESNKLLAVDELSGDTVKGSDFSSAGSPGDDYSYNSDGSLVRDGNKSIRQVEYNHLNLPVKVGVEGAATGEIVYVYDALGNRLEKLVRDRANDLTTRSCYLGNFTYEKVGAAPFRLTMIAHEDGRIRPLATEHGTGYAFDYFLRDHLGNVRMVLTDEENVHAYPMATLEEKTLAEEKKYYRIPDDASRVSRQDVPGYPDATENQENQYVQRLQGNGTKTGSSILLRVMSGDKISIRVTSWYRDRSAQPAGDNPLEEIIAAVLGSLAGPGIGKMVNSGDAAKGLLAPAFGRFLQTQQPGETGNGKPAAFVNWLLLDEQMNPVITEDGSNSGFDRVGEPGELKQHQVIDRALTHNGYLYIYLSNTSGDTPVYFDDLQVTHTPGPLLEETHYYPFGGKIDAISSRAMGGPANNKLYNGIEYNDALELDTYDAFYRTLDPQTGRWWQLDPKVEQGYESLSPYNSMFNDPIRYSDLMGDEAGTNTQCCEITYANIKETVKETATGLAGAGMQIANTINKYVNPLTPIAEFISGKDLNNGYFNIDKPRSQAAMEMAISLVPGGKIEGAIARGVAQSAVQFEERELINGLSRTEPKLPPKTIVEERNVEIIHYTRSGDHGPAHLHVKGEGAETKIGQNGKPLRGSPELTSTQRQVVINNKQAIRKAVKQIMKWHNYNKK